MLAPVWKERMCGCSPDDLKKERMMTQEGTTNNQNIHDEAMWEKAHSAETPEAYFRCAGVDFDSHLLMDIHFQDDSPGYLSPAELYYGELVEPDTELAVCGFFCPNTTVAHSLTWYFPPRI